MENHSKNSYSIALSELKQKIHSEAKAYSIVCNRSNNLVVQRIFFKLWKLKTKFDQELRKEFTATGIRVHRTSRLDVCQIFPFFQTANLDVLKKSYIRESENLENYNRLISVCHESSTKTLLLMQKKALSQVLKEIKCLGLRLPDLSLKEQRYEHQKGVK